ncbi:hypothetical protein LXA43DRAFT_1182910 [Ganoderma leucocontextum]|nr:hypothetical protein LXA43DRAFT_1182910 [Ganoderma leucocontextum]
MASLLSSASTSSASTVVVPPTIHCGGGFVEGEVLLNFRQLQEENFDEVRVELSGNIQTRVRRNKHVYEESSTSIHLRRPTGGRSSQRTGVAHWGRRRSSRASRRSCRTSSTRTSRRSHTLRIASSFHMTPRSRSSGICYGLW